MEALDKLEARKALRLDPNQVLKPAEVRTFDDIKRLVAELDPKRNPHQANVPLSTTLTANEDNKNVIYKVDAHTRSKSKRDMLVDGLDIIKTRMESAARIAELQEEVEVNGVVMKPARLGYQTEGTSWVDPLIKQWLGGYRDGFVICWNLSDGYTYLYDIYQHKLYRKPTPN